MNSQEELNKLVSVHLGKAGDGTIVNPYVTPDEVDPGLLFFLVVLIATCHR